jgi:hypothetical protein
MLFVVVCICTVSEAIIRDCIQLRNWWSRVRIPPGAVPFEAKFVFK